MITIILIKFLMQRIISIKKEVTTKKIVTETKLFIL